MTEDATTSSRRVQLNSKDVTSFNKVPKFIINNFFGKCTYKSRLIATTFCVLNGVSPEQCFMLCHFIDLKRTDIEKIKQLYNYLKLEENSRRYYSYCVHFEKVFFLNGDLYLNKQRVTHHNIFPRIPATQNC